MPEISCLCMHFKDLSKVANKYTISMSQTKCTIEIHVLPTATDKESLYANMNHMNVVPPRSSSQTQLPSLQAKSYRLQLALLRF